MQAGDLVFCSTTGIIGRSIQFAQRKNGEVDWYRNHVGVLDSPTVDGNWYVIQAEPRGVTNNKLLTEIAVGGTYEVATLPSTVNREKFLELSRSQVGRFYGYLSILSIAGNMFLPEKFHFRWSDSVCCSGLVALGLLYGGFPPMAAVEDIYDITPAQVKRLVTGN